MNVTNEITVKGNLIEKSHINIYYRGKFTREFSNEVFIVFGYGANWENRQEQKMIWFEDCFFTEILLEQNGELNFCFRNDYNNWDNNDYKNYSIFVEPSISDYENKIIEICNINQNNESENFNYSNNEQIDNNKFDENKYFDSNENINKIIDEEKENLVNDEDSFFDITNTDETKININLNEIVEPAKESIKSTYNTRRKEKFQKNTKKNKKSRRQKKFEKKRPRISYSYSEESLYRYFGEKEYLDSNFIIENITNGEEKLKTRKKKSKQEKRRNNFKRYKKNKVKNRIRIICIILLLSCITYISVFFLKFREAQKQNTNLLNTVKVESSIKPEEIEVVESERLKQVKELNSQYPELKGWIEVEETNINYPLMQCTDNEYYMTHDYKKEYSRWGSLFLDKKYDWSIPSSNLLVYGHNFSDGLMFADLLKYKDKSFFESHPTIKFTTPAEEAEYEIIAVFFSRVYYKSEKNVFRYYFFVNAETEEEYNEFVTKAKSASIYDTGKTAKYGDQLITLSTCEYSQEDGRFVVVARKK